MKKLATLVFAMLLTGSLTFAQAGGGSTGVDQKKPAATPETEKKAKKGAKKGHKGGKKSKKGSASSSSGSTTPK